MDDDEVKIQIELAKKLLTEHGFKISIFGCGCCGSPRVRLEHKGMPIIHDVLNCVDNCIINMFDNESKAGESK